MNLAICKIFRANILRPPCEMYPRTPMPGEWEIRENEIFKEQVSSMNENRKRVYPTPILKNTEKLLCHVSAHAWAHPGRRQVALSLVIKPSHNVGGQWGATATSLCQIGTSYLINIIHALPLCTTSRSVSESFIKIAENGNKLKLN